jgi:hypothetical protein
MPRDGAIIFGGLIENLTATLRGAEFRFSGAKRTCRNSAPRAGFDPNVWSGRASQEVFAENAAL